MYVLRGFRCFIIIIGTILCFFSLYRANEYNKMHDIQEHVEMQTYLTSSWHRLSANGLNWRRIIAKKPVNWEIEGEFKKRKKRHKVKLHVHFFKECAKIWQKGKKKNDLDKVTKQNWYKNVWSKSNTNVYTEILLQYLLKFLLKAYEPKLVHVLLTVIFSKERRWIIFFTLDYFSFFNPLEVKLYNVLFPSLQLNTNMMLMSTF